MKRLRGVDQHADTGKSPALGLTVVLATSRSQLCSEGKWECRERERSEGCGDWISYAVSDPFPLSFVEAWDPGPLCPALAPLFMAEGG